MCLRHFVKSATVCKILNSYFVNGTRIFRITMSRSKRMHMIRNCDSDDERKQLERDISTRISVMQNLTMSIREMSLQNNNQHFVFGLSQHLVTQQQQTSYVKSTQQTKALLSTGAQKCSTLWST